MIKKYILPIFLIFALANDLVGQDKGEPIILSTETGDIMGTLLIPERLDKVSVVLIISGSGPTDRNGNHPVMSNNALKMLAERLYENGIASLRFDKRGIRESRASGFSESDLRFENYINDVKEWCALLKKDHRFDRLIILGHSEGSLIGMIAAQATKVDKFVSVAGAGFPAGEIIRQQLQSQSPIVLVQALPIIEKLEQGEKVTTVPQMLYSLFRPSVQSYMISWFKYDPQTEISKLDCPVLIVQGTTDIQVSLADAQKLSEANKGAKKVIIEGMNHILKESELDRAKNIQTYNNPELPLKEELIMNIVDFVVKE
ncbi:MAG: alpha/beta hydrolase [Saonia sp.]